MNVRRHVFLILLFFLALPCSVHGSDDLVVHFFYGEGCPHCRKEERYLKVCEERYANLRIQRYEVYFKTENMELLQRVGERLGSGSPAVPFLVVGGEFIVGFEESLTPDMIREKIEKCLPGGCPDIMRELQDGKNGRTPQDAHLETTGAAGDRERAGPMQADVPAGRDWVITVPLLGDINVFAYSLPVLTVVMGVLDGFNPCAMWALVFLISLLIGMRDRRRIWFLGSTFIAASALVYFLFMAAWLNIILFFGLIIWIRLAIGVIALAGGVFSIRDVLTNPEISCKMNGEARRREFRIRLRKVIDRNSLPLSMLGIALLAFMVNLVEIVCSAGFPAIYTQVLSLNALPVWQYYSYILLYILFFMLDDMIVFVAAMITLEITGATTRYVRWARLIGGLLMLVIGGLLIFRPQWLMLG